MDLKLTDKVAFLVSDVSNKLSGQVIEVSAAALSSRGGGD